MTEKNPLCFYSPVALTTNMVYEHCHTEICGFFVQIFHLATEGHQAEAYGQPFFSFESGHWHQQNKEHCKWMDCKRKTLHTCTCVKAFGARSPRAPGSPVSKVMLLTWTLGGARRKSATIAPTEQAAISLPRHAKGLWKGSLVW